MQGDVYALDFSPHGSTLAVGCNIDCGSSIRLWDPTTGEPLGESEEIRGEYIWHLRFSPDGANLVSSHDRTAHTWDTAVLQATAPAVEAHPAPTSDHQKILDGTEAHTVLVHQCTLVGLSKSLSLSATVVIENVLQF